MLALQEHAAQDRNPIDGAVPAGHIASAARRADFRRQKGNAALLTLAGDPLEIRYRCWRGASGRRYVFSVYSAQTCPAYSHAVLMVVAVRPDGDRAAAFLNDTGAFPDIALAKALLETATARSEIEIHIHLLAGSVAERRAVMADLAQAHRN